MRRTLIALAATLLVSVTACGDDDAAPATTVVSATAAPATTAAAATTAAPAPDADASDGAAGDAAGDQDCAAGTYGIIDAEFWANAALAGGEGGAGTSIGGDLRLELGADGSAAMVLDNWTFRLSFPGQSETMRGVNTGDVTGSWTRSDDGLQFTVSSDNVTASFMLESAAGAMAVPGGESLMPSTGTYPLIVDCATGRAELRAVTFVWPFQRR